MSTPAPTFVRGGVSSPPRRSVADAEFTHSVNTARAAFEASLREHSVMEGPALSRILEAFDSSVAEISTAVVTRVSHATAVGSFS